jgi:phenylacetate-CoA ligase
MPEIDFRVRDFAHPWLIWRLKSEFDRTQWSSPADREQYQAYRLARVVRAAYETVPYYRRLFAEHGFRPSDFRTPKDIAKLPLLKKQQLRESARELLGRRARRNRARLAFTGGTTSEPLQFYLDKYSRALEFVYYWRHFGWAGYRLGDRFAQLNAQEFIDRPGEPIHEYQPHLKRLLLNSGAISERNVQPFAAILRRHAPQFLKGLASPLYYLAMLFQEHGVRDIGFRAVFSSGETLFEARRRVIERTFGCRVLDSFGLMEQAAAISECPEGGLHVNDDYSLVELRPEGLPHGDGRMAALVGSTLHNLTMPLLRYETGDLVEPLNENEPCRCGRTLPRVAKIHGRIEDSVVTPDGRYVTALFLVPDKVIGIRQIQFVQEGRSVLAAKLVVSEAFNAAEEARFRHYANRLVGSEMKLAVERVEPSAIKRTRTGKVPLVISKMQASTLAAADSADWEKV